MITNTTTPAQAATQAGADTAAQGNSWAEAAQPATPAQPDQAATPPAVDPTNAPMAPTAQQTAADMPNAAPAPVVITPQKRGGLLGLVDSIADVMAGKTKPEIATDQQGNKYVKETTLSHGEQWARIGSELVAGAAKGLAAGRGGNFGAAAAAGVDEGAHITAAANKNRQDLTAEARQQNLDNANNQILRMNMAKATWEATRQQVEATQHDVTFANSQIDRMVKDGGTVLGTAAHPGDIGDILKVNPDVMKDMIQKHQIEIMPHYDGDGKRAGITVIKMPAGYRTSMLPSGSTFHTFDETTGQYVEHTASDPMTAGERDDYEHAAGIAAQNFQTKQSQIAKDQAETQAAKDKSRTVDSEIDKNKAQTQKFKAEAGKANVEAKQLRRNLAVTDGTDLSLTHDKIVGGMLNGSVDITKAVGIFKDPHAREQYIADAIAKDPTWTMQKYQNMLKMREDMTSGKLGDQIQSFNAFLGHAAGVDASVNTLRNSNTPFINHSINWLRTNASNNTAVAAMLPEIDATRNEFQNFLANHALQKSEIAKGEKLISEDQTPAQMQAAIKTFMQVALTKMGAVRSRINQTMGNETPDLITPQNQTAITNLGLKDYANGYGLMSTAPQQALPDDHQQQAVAAGVPVGGRPGYVAGKLAGYFDAQNVWHAIGGK